MGEGGSSAADELFFLSFVRERKKEKDKGQETGEKGQASFKQQK